MSTKELVFKHYGIAPTSVMRDPAISIGAKSLYSYLMTYVSFKDLKKDVLKAWPSRKRIMHELNVSVNTLTKYIAELKDHGLISVEQQRQKNAFGSNLYIIHKTRRKKAQHHNICDTQKESTSNTRSLSNTKKDLKTRHTTKVLSSHESLNEIQSLIEDIIERPIKRIDKECLNEILHKHDPGDVELATIEFMYQYDLQQNGIKNPIRYIKGVISKWKKEGMRISDPLEILKRQSKLEPKIGGSVVFKEFALSNITS